MYIYESVFSYSVFKMFISWRIKFEFSKVSAELLKKENEDKVTLNLLYRNILYLQDSWFIVTQMVLINVSLLDQSFYSGEFLLLGSICGIRKLHFGTPGDPLVQPLV